MRKFETGMRKTMLVSFKMKMNMKTEKEMIMMLRMLVTMITSATRCL